MPLKIAKVYDKKESIPAGFADAFKEKDGKWELDTSELEIEGMGAAGAQDGDVKRLDTALKAERKAHGETKKKIAEAESKRDEVQAALDDLQLQVDAGDKKVSQEKVAEIVNERVKQKTGPLQAKIDQLTKQVSDKDGEIVKLTADGNKFRIRTQVGEALDRAKVSPEARSDALDLCCDRIFELNDEGVAIVRDGSGFTVGASADDFAKEAKTKKAYWWPNTQGAGSNGGGGGGGSNEPNPFTHKDWNMTAQAKLAGADRTKAEALAKQAGTTVGGPRPPATPGTGAKAA